jgi:hypothetical protein
VDRPLAGKSVRWWIPCETLRRHMAPSRRKVAAWSRLPERRRSGSWHLDASGRRPDSVGPIRRAALAAARVRTSLGSVHRLGEQAAERRLRRGAQLWVGWIVSAVVRGGVLIWLWAALVGGLVFCAVGASGASAAGSPLFTPVPGSPF